MEKQPATFNLSKKAKGKSNLIKTKTFTRAKYVQLDLDQVHTNFTLVFELHKRIWKIKLAKHPYN